MQMYSEMNLTEIFLQLIQCLQKRGNELNDVRKVHTHWTNEITIDRRLCEDFGDLRMKAICRV